jgi:arsenate reductase
LTDTLKQTSESLIKDFEAILQDRKALLDELAIYIKGKLISRREVCLIFICTHNSRRSHMAQIWAQTAAAYYNIPSIKTFSGGTQKTAFNILAVNALKKAGFKIKALSEKSNPKYRVKISKKTSPLICFSKKYSHRSNPQRNFVAIMTCSDADESCPVITGAEYRTTIKYEDPKIFDGTDKAAAAYEHRSRQIGTEMLYVFSKVAGF